jgi:hypothetical protein
LSTYKLDCQICLENTHWVSRCYVVSFSCKQREHGQSIDLDKLCDQMSKSRAWPSAESDGARLQPVAVSQLAPNYKILSAINILSSARLACSSPSRRIFTATRVGQLALEDGVPRIASLSYLVLRPDLRLQPSLGCGTSA